MSALVHDCLSCCCRLATASRQQPCAHGGRRTVPHRLRRIHPVLALHAVARHLSLPSRSGCSVDPQKDWDKWRARRPAFSLSGPPPPLLPPHFAAHSLTHHLHWISDTMPCCSTCRHPAHIPLLPSGTLHAPSLDITRVPSNHATHAPALRAPTPNYPCNNPPSPPAHRAVLDGLSSPIAPSSSSSPATTVTTSHLPRVIIDYTYTSPTHRSQVRTPHPNPHAIYTPLSSSITRMQGLASKLLDFVVAMCRWTHSTPPPLSAVTTHILHAHFTHTSNAPHTHLTHTSRSLHTPFTRPQHVRLRRLRVGHRTQRPLLDVTRLQRRLQQLHCSPFEHLLGHASAGARLQSCGCGFECVQAC